MVAAIKPPALKRGYRRAAGLRHRRKEATSRSFCGRIDVLKIDVEHLEGLIVGRLTADLASNAVGASAP